MTKRQPLEEYRASLEFLLSSIDFFNATQTEEFVTWVDFCNGHEDLSFISNAFAKISRQASPLLSEGALPILLFDFLKQGNTADSLYKHLCGHSNEQSLIQVIELFMQIDYYFALLRMQTQFQEYLSRQKKSWQILQSPALEKSALSSPPMQQLVPSLDIPARSTPSQRVDVTGAPHIKTVQSRQDPRLFRKRASAPSIMASGGAGIESAKTVRRTKSMPSPREKLHAKLALLREVSIQIKADKEYLKLSDRLGTPLSDKPPALGSDDSARKPRRAMSTLSR